MRRGTRVGQAYVALTADGSGINEDIIDAVDEAGPGVEKAGEEHGRRYGEGFDRESSGFFGRIREKLASHLSGASDTAGEESGKTFARRFESGLDDAMLARIGDRIGGHIGGHMVDALNHALTTDGFEGNALRELFNKIDQAAVSGNKSKQKSLGDRIGGLLGGGSRNNALNLIGKSIGNVINLTQGLGRVSASAFKTFSDGMNNAAEGAGLFSKLFAGAGAVGSSAMSSLVASGPAAALAIGVVIVAASVLTSVLSGLLGIVTALAATITSGLVGAMTVGAGALGALIVAGGLATIMFTSLTDAQKKLLADGFRPVKEVLTGLGQIMAQPLFAGNPSPIEKWANNLNRALTLLAPVARVMGEAFAIAGRRLTNAFSGPGFQNLAGALTRELPAITRNFAGALGGFLNGLAGLFAAILPFVTDFAEHLDKVGRSFSKWANDAKNQRGIQDFVTRALTSLKSLWNFVKEVGGLLSDLLFNPKGQDAGNSMFDGLTRAVRRFRNFIADGRLEKWFQDAEKFGKRLGDMFAGLGRTVTELDNSGVLDSVGKAIEGITAAIKLANIFLGPMITMLGTVLPPAVWLAVAPLKVMAEAVDKLADAIRRLPSLPGKLKDLAGDVGGGLKSGLTSLGSNLPFTRMAGRVPPSRAFDRMLRDGTEPVTTLGTDTTESLQQLGAQALAQTDIKPSGSGDGKDGKGKKGKWKNPYLAFAQSLIDNGPSMAQQIRQLIRDFNKQMKTAFDDALKATDADSVISSFGSLSESMRSSADQMVESAQSALNSAAENLASATTKKAAKKALKEVRASQKELAAALSGQARLDAAARILDGQSIVSAFNVEALLAGMQVQNATLADFAEARGLLAEKMEDAKSKLESAISLRDDFAKSVADSLKSFAALTTAQGQTLNGVEQAVTHSDITANLTARLGKIRDFQSNLRILLAQGLSQAAYKQIVDAGVEGGSAYAAALVAGGAGAIQQVDDLLAQIGAASDGLGSEAASFMYQAGVDAAQGLVDGLTSLSAGLESAAWALGQQIAASLKAALGIASPSKVLRDMMDSVGDGAVQGLDRQHGKVALAANRFAAAIAPTPQAAAQAGQAVARQSGQVSGNGDSPYFRDLIVQTPSENPRAVAVETVNEMVGRL